MSKVKPLLASVACALALAACASSGSDFMKAAAPTMTLRFESEPQNAEVKTSSGQTCRTPCSLAVPASDLTTTFALNGYQPQTIPVKLQQPDDPREDPTPRFNPNPVYAELEVAVKRPGKKTPAAKKPVASGDAKPPRRAASGQSAAPSNAAPPPPSSPWPPAANPVR